MMLSSGDYGRLVIIHLGLLTGQRTPICIPGPAPHKNIDGALILGVSGSGDQEHAEGKFSRRCNHGPNITLLDRLANAYPLLSLAKPVATNVSIHCRSVLHYYVSQSYRLLDKSLIRQKSLRPKRASESSRRDLQFSSDQTWVRVAKSFNFVDETQEVVNIYETESQESGSGNEKTNSKTTDVASPSERSASHHSHGVPSPWPYPSPANDLENGNPSQVAWSETINSIHMQSPSETNQRAKDVDGAVHSSLPTNDSNFGFQALLNAGRLLDYGGNCPDSLDMPVQAEIGPNCVVETYDTQRTWPLKDKLEAQLFCHWIRNVAPLFDLCDHERHFAIVVPQRATTCPPLLNAILAASAKHSSCMGLLTPLVADRYYQKSLETIIPILSSHTVVRDENLLAAIVILRFVEESDIPFSPVGPQSHLIGTRAFLAARDRTHKFGKLGVAVFWLALRQEIFMALIHSRAVHPDLLIEDIVSPLEPPKCDCDYANRVIVQAALCLQYCFGEEDQRSSWAELNQSLDRWYADRPWQFYSITVEEDGNQFLPEPKYISDAVVTGLQHYYLARLILEAHNPTAPKLGPARKMHLTKTDQEMKHIVRKICGIAKANPHTIPGCVCASISIVIAGDRFTDRHEQEILYNILVETGQDLGWPTGSAYDALMFSNIPGLKHM
ncbi:hypothetical protein FHL15_006975 [Xylaria flabelliformis]|uniref:ARCA protein n=1 Tax=Xylaria flabelliformis TaxID=2512241 RepID=A0A553HVY8_9PEZI|nr:hypothetical protein FHL15_006975 [Xylaria flabelliformis]